MDPQLPDGVNELIADTGHRFCTPEFGGGQDYLLAVLNEEERERLRRGAGWKV